MLDNIENINQIDKSNMLDDLAKTPYYCLDAIIRAKKVKINSISKPKNIVIIGMGGSAIGGEILRDWLRERLQIPIEVCRDYILPAYVNKDTLIFANSYSGNTEETLTSFLEATRRKCTIIAITSGGQLEAFCKKIQVTQVRVPKGLQPRVAIPYMFFPLPILLEKIGILSDIESELKETINILERITQANSPEVNINNNRAKYIAQEILGTKPIIYGFRQYSSVAYRLKAQFNENSKIPSKSDVFPEINHNETVGYEAPSSIIKTHSIILIRDSQEPLEIKNRIEVTSKLVFSRAKKIIEINTEGKGRLAKMFSVICIGDFVSIYLAILQNKDPSPVKIIERVKQELAKKSNKKKFFDSELAKL
ncbi:bifunctional phosphoglucose/phosphomannose isomerase [Candidatus Bathyarchaeota archaeon]|nr:bifunctional phosphoglucose/phosphomannose isomerase [Candidatus Bathyarchaeota archaeon]